MTQGGQARRVLLWRAVRALERIADALDAAPAVEDPVAGDDTEVAVLAGLAHPVMEETL